MASDWRAQDLFWLASWPVLALGCLFLLQSSHAADVDGQLISRYFAEHTAVMLLIDPLDGRILDANRQAERFYGVTLEELRRQRIDDINAYPPEQVAELRAQAAAGARNFFIFPHHTRPQGVRSVAVYSSAVSLPSGQTALLSIIHDVSGHLIPEEDSQAYREELERLVNASSRELLAQREQRIRLDSWLMAGLVAIIFGLVYAYLSRLRGLEALKQKSFEARKLEIAVDQSPASIVITDCDGTIEYVNQTCIQNTGYSREELIGHNPRVLQSGRTPREVYADLWSTIKAGRSWEGRLINRRKNGSEFVEWVLISPVLDDHDHPIRFIAVKEDITEREQLAKRLQSLERYDALTGLANRFAFFGALEQRLAQIQSEPQCQALALINLDRFHGFNEAHGHEAGDQLLQLVARRLLDHAPPHTLIARLGPDEFAVLPPLEFMTTGQADRLSDMRWLQRIQRALNTPYGIGGHTLTASATIGVAFWDRQSCPDGTGRPGDFMRRTDSALHMAKARGGGQIAFFDAEASTQIQEALRLEQDLALAIERSELWLALQAQIGAGGKLVGAEALLRWRHASLGEISPGRFIPLAEESGSIIAIGRWVMAQALTVLARMQQTNPTLKLSINISPLQVHHPNFIAMVEQLLADSPVKPSGLVMEITESVFMSDPELAEERLQALRALGIGIAIDDFGTGYSSLSYLKRLPVTELKIDQSFIAGLPDDPADSALVNIIVSAASQLRLRVVAEGVETAEQAAFFKNVPNAELQGYLFDRPAPVEEWIERWLQMQH